MSWRDRPFFGLDLETTGTDPETATIVTACVGLAGGAHRWTARTWLLQQAYDIPAEATAVHGITTEHANQHGTDPVRALRQIIDDLDRGWAMGMPLVIYNAPYDLTVLDRNLRRHDLPPLLVAGPVIDPLVIGRELDPDKYLKRPLRLTRLAIIYRALGITADPADEAAPGWYSLRIAHYRVFGCDMVGDAHGADADARAACRLAWAMSSWRPVGEDWSKTGNGRTPHPSFASWSLDGLHQWQTEAYESQRRSLAAYLQRQGKALDDPSTAWPMKPFPVPAESAHDLEPAPF